MGLDILKREVILSTSQILKPYFSSSLIPLLFVGDRWGFDFKEDGGPPLDLVISLILSQYQLHLMASIRTSMVECRSTSLGPNGAVHHYIQGQLLQVHCKVVVSDLVPQEGHRIKSISSNPNHILSYSISLNHVY